MEPIFALFACLNKTKNDKIIKSSLTVWTICQHCVMVFKILFWNTDFHNDAHSSHWKKTFILFRECLLRCCSNKRNQISNDNLNSLTYKLEAFISIGSILFQRNLNPLGIFKQFGKCGSISPIKIKNEMLLTNKNGT